MVERNGIYYFTYSSGSVSTTPSHPRAIREVTADGEFKMGPNNPILALNSDETVDGPGHHSILNTVMITTLSTTVTTFRDAQRHASPGAAVDRLGVRARRRDSQVEPTHRGIGQLAARTRSANLCRGAKVTASLCTTAIRSAITNIGPSMPSDDNNATLWRAGNKGPGQWLQVDLGTPQPIRRIETQFEYGTWYYQYLIEHSQDGEHWQVLADRRQNTRWGSPLVDEADCEARYLRLTITGTELPGLLGAVWNFKVYVDAPDDPFRWRWQTGVLHRRRIVVPSLAAGSRNGDQRADERRAADLSGSCRAAAWRALAVSGLTGDLWVANSPAPRTVRWWAWLAAGRPCDSSGREILTASFPSPRSLAGNSSFTRDRRAGSGEPRELGRASRVPRSAWAGRGGVRTALRPIVAMAATSPLEPCRATGFCRYGIPPWAARGRRVASSGVRVRWRYRARGRRSVEQLGGQDAADCTEGRPDFTWERPYLAPNTTTATDIATGF